MLKFLERLRRRPTAPPRVVVDPSGFSLVDSNDTSARVLWSSITRVLAYKRDRFTTDEIVIVFVQRGDLTHSLEVSEECTGFADLFAPLERELGVSPEWYLRTSAKPFDPDVQIVYERAALDG